MLRGRAAPLRRGLHRHLRAARGGVGAHRRRGAVPHARRAAPGGHLHRGARHRPQPLHQPADRGDLRASARGLARRPAPVGDAAASRGPRPRPGREPRHRGQDEWTSEYRSIDRDGRTIWLHNAARLVRDADGAPRFWQGLVFDITERKTAEQHLREAEERYRHLVEQMPVAVYTDAVDELSTAVYISPRYEDLTGYTPEERLGGSGPVGRDPAPRRSRPRPDRVRADERDRRCLRRGVPRRPQGRTHRVAARPRQPRDGTRRGPDLAGRPAGRHRPSAPPPTPWRAVTRSSRRRASPRRGSSRPSRGSRISDEVLERLGTAAGAARAYVYATAAVDEDVEATPLRSWGTELRDAPGFGMRAAGLGRWIEELGAGRPVHGPVPELPEAERAIFDRSPRPGRQHPRRPDHRRRRVVGFRRPRRSRPDADAGTTARSTRSPPRRTRSAARSRASRPRAGTRPSSSRSRP